MPTSKKPEPYTNIGEMRWDNNKKAWMACYKPKRFRVLFDGGEVSDVIAIGDDSFMRKALLDATNQPGIVGVAECDMEEQPETVEFVDGPI